MFSPGLLFDLYCKSKYSTLFFILEHSINFELSSQPFTKISCEQVIICSMYLKVNLFRCYEYKILMQTIFEKICNSIDLRWHYSQLKSSRSGYYMTRSRFSIIANYCSPYAHFHRAAANQFWSIMCMT